MEVEELVNQQTSLRDGADSTNVKDSIEEATQLQELVNLNQQTPLGHGAGPVDSSSIASIDFK